MTFGAAAPPQGHGRAVDRGLLGSFVLMSEVPLDLHDPVRVTLGEPKLMKAQGRRREKNSRNRGRIAA